MQLHASCVALAGRGVLIRGPSGSGKSSLALALMSMGAELVADDRTDIRLEEGHAVARAPERLRGMIEARGIGLLHAAAAPSARLCAVVDMGRTETERLPPDRTAEIAGHRLPLFHKVESGHFAAALRQYLLGGKAEI